MTNLRQVVSCFQGEAARAFMSAYIGQLYKAHKDDARWDMKRPALCTLFADYASRVPSDGPRSNYRIEADLNLATYAVDKVVDALAIPEDTAAPVPGIVQDLLSDYWAECQVDECQCSVDARMHFKVLHVQALIDEQTASSAAADLDQASHPSRYPALHLVA